tara:strand:- start:907 stop:1146 length:240 start_codon:yes stop_codon:yes gene_type:complete
MAASSRLTFVLSLIDWAKPAASSCGLTILEPEDRRASDAAICLVFLSKRIAAFVAARFVLITKSTIPFVSVVGVHAQKA